MLDLTELPDEISATATLAMIGENPRLRDILVALMDHIHEQEDARGLKKQYDHMIKVFKDSPPPSYDGEEVDPVSTAKSLIGMGLIISINNEFAEYVQQSLHAIVSGTREMVDNMTGFTEENI